MGVGVNVRVGRTYDFTIAGETAFFVLRAKVVEIYIEEGDTKVDMIEDNREGLKYGINFGAIVKAIKVQ